MDSVISVDTDVLFLSDPELFWRNFEKFNQSQIAGLSKDDNDPNGWYKIHSRVPLYGNNGLNAGVMLLNLTRMREFKFTDKIITYYPEYKDKLMLGDQCLINIFFHFNPGNSAIKIVFWLKK